VVLVTARLARSEVTVKAGQGSVNEPTEIVDPVAGLPIVQCHVEGSALVSGFKTARPGPVSLGDIYAELLSLSHSR
jgi:hypothetical protein